MSCIENGCNAWLEIRKNGDQAHPIRKKNPELENPFNWTMRCSLPRTEEELKKCKFFNEMEKDLTHNWTFFFGTKETVALYQKEGIPTKELFSPTGGYRCPVRIKTTDAIREDGYKYGYWMVSWVPKPNISYWIVDESIPLCFHGLL